ncbi:hypothetical protein [Pontibacter harenae]|uniref:hypothetical protein n=1 Tax=Pontibacter harenae TaxID=2894083 RepID=UPI001E4FEDA7|nr:hypothetical protein [Pontibacter harenae]MCC9168124.1 hypothetical protein [Pontibacter harenae]
MQTLTNQKQQLTRQQGRKRQKAQQTLVNASNPGESQEQPSQQEEGLYQLVKEDDALQVYHTARLLDTPGYSHLSVEEAGEMVEQMLRLSTLMYEMLLDTGETPLKDHYLPEKSAVSESNYGSND